MTLLEKLAFVFTLKNSEIDKPDKSEGLNIGFKEGFRVAKRMLVQQELNGKKDESIVRWIEGLGEEEYDIASYLEEHKKKDD